MLALHFFILLCFRCCAAPQDTTVTPWWFYSYFCPSKTKIERISTAHG